MNIKPIFILSRGAGIFIAQNGRIEFNNDREKVQNRISIFLQDLNRELKNEVNILEELVVKQPSDLNIIFSREKEIDCLIVYFLGVTPIEKLLEFQGPIIAFGGEYTPAFALYAMGEERHERRNIYIALDYTEIRKILKVIEVKRLLSQTRVVLFGLPAPWHLRWSSFPDLELIRRKLGLEFIPVELRELIEVVEELDREMASSVAMDWMKNAHQVIEPSIEDVTESAAIYLAFEKIMAQKGSRAMAINCLEITQSRKFSGRIINPCFAMSQLRDKGIPSACEMDVAGLITMIILGYLGKKPSFLGNIVRAEPEKNIIKISHCIMPSRMPGFEEKPLPYIMRDFHGEKGVTAFVDVPSGTNLTIARAHRNLIRMVAMRGKVISSEDTSFCRNTLTIQIENVREFIRHAEGNHHAVVIGDCIEDLKDLSKLLQFKLQVI